MRPVTRCLLAVAFASAAAAAMAQDVRTEPVRFEPGRSDARITGSITGDETVSYTLDAEAGQTLAVALEASNIQTYFNLYAPGTGPGDQAIANGGLTSPEVNRFEGALAQSGRYTISVYLMRAAARRDERSDYTLDVGLTGALAPVVEGDFADGLQGGPDWWQVATQGGPLNLRAGPSTGAAPVGQVPDGAALRNAGGCRATEGRRWCQVATPGDALTGWAAGDYLREGAAP